MNIARFDGNGADILKLALFSYLTIVLAMSLACEPKITQLRPGPAADPHLAPDAAAGSATAGTANEGALPPADQAQDSVKRRPLLRLAFTQWMEGHLEPCGCASAQSGGMDRRGYWLKRNKHLYDLALEGGNLIEEKNAFEDLKLQTSLLILRGHLEEEGYGALPLGPVDLSLGTETLHDYDEAWGPVFFCTDLRQKKGGKLVAPFATHRILEAGSYNLLLLDLAGHVEGTQQKNLVFVEPGKAIEEALAAAGQRGRDYDMVICFAYQSPKRGLRTLLGQLPGVDLVVGQVRDLHLMGSPKPEVHERKEAVHGVRRTSLIFPGGQGRRMLLWKGRPDPGQGWKTSKLEIVDLPARREERKNSAGMPLTADADIWMQLRELKQQIADQNMVEKLANRRPTVNGARYVGNKVCQACHTRAARVWKKSGHAKAWHVLEERDKTDKLPMTRQPDCVRCHTVGFGEVSGYTSPSKTPQLLAVGCEVCHGPSSKHVDAMKALPDKPGKKVVEAALAEAPLVEANAQTCARCHDAEQSPGFQFKDRWKRIKH